MKILPILSVLVILIYWACLCRNIFAVAGLCLDDQQSLLLQLKNNLIFENESSSKLKLWNQTDCCHWSGVTCDGEGHVIGLDLSREFISGGLDNSSSLFSLQHLQSLNLAYNDFKTVIPSTINKLENLTHLNLSYAGFEGQIPIEISQLTRLVALDLSSYYYLTVTGPELKLENPNLQKLVQNLTNIRQLNLDGAHISAQGQEWSNALLLLPGLQELSMSDCNLSGPLVSSLTRLENLSVIILDYNNLSSPVPETFANFKKLTTLSLAFCDLMGTFPQKIFQVSTMAFIDISGNYYLHGSFPVFPPNGSLQTIIASHTSFSGALPSSIGNMVQLSTFDLTGCKFNGTLPRSLSKLTELSHLDLSSNHFTGPIPPFSMANKLTHIYLSDNYLSSAIPLFAHIEGLQNLISIDLSHNFISGSIPSYLFTLPSLQEIQLSYNQFSQLEEFTNVSSSTLTTLDLSSNNLSGPIPASIFQLRGLSNLRLSSNKFNGSMQLNKLFELRNLTTIDLSYNNLSDNVDVTYDGLSSLLNIGFLKLASCRLKSFPGFLRYQSGLSYLDLSDNQIQGTMPNWIWKLGNLLYLNVSHNFLTDLEGPLQNLIFTLNVLDLHHNQLQGHIPGFPKHAYYVDYSSNNFSSVIPADIGVYLYYNTFYLSLSNNSFYGSIPDSLCNASGLQVLDLSHNKFSGTVPSCLMMSSKVLEVLNLGRNNLTGSIPYTFPSPCNLRTLDLNGNLLDGPLPKSLSNCTSLEVLDLGRNQIIGGFPCFLNKISALRVLVLRNNKFHGPIGCPKANANGVWNMLQIVDLAFNRFSGKLPGNLFTSLKAMMPDEGKAKSEEQNFQLQVQLVDETYYQDSVTVISKGQKIELVKILRLFTSIDFSNNQFEGPIPEELMDLKVLHVLNLSSNSLSGQIPSSVGNLKQLESLDLSNNSLEGKIPIEIASLNFLSCMNLSFNHLTGMIPTGTQIQSFQPNAFEGNDGLYGPPLTRIPDGRTHRQPPPALPPSCGRLACSVDWNFVSVELGLVFGLGIVIGPLLFWKKWRWWYCQRLDRILCRIFPQMSLEYETRGGQSYKVLRWRY